MHWPAATIGYVSVPPSDYDREYALRHSVAADNWLFDTLLALLAPQPGWRILDVGCNTGEFTARLAVLQCQMVGIDLNPAAIALAQERFPQLAFRVAELAEIPEVDFDAIIASHVIEHLAEPEKFLREAHRRLKRGAKLVIATPNRHAFLHKLVNRLRGAPFFDDPTHHHLFAPRELSRLVTQAGFASVQVTTYPLYVPVAGFVGRHVPTFGMGDHMFINAATTGP